MRKLRLGQGIYLYKATQLARGKAGVHTFTRRSPRLSVLASRPPGVSPMCRTSGVRYERKGVELPGKV